MELAEWKEYSRCCGVLRWINDVKAKCSGGFEVRKTGTEIELRRMHLPQAQDKINHFMFL